MRRQIAAEEGAGTLVYVGRFDLAEFAVVLEPEEPLRDARRALYAGLTALADALAVYAPPDKPIAFDWPDAMRVDGGLVGGAPLGWPDGADENEPPAWLVFGGMIRTVAMGEDEPGAAAACRRRSTKRASTSSAPGRLVESFARHLMVAIDAWQEKGFAEVARNYLARLAPESGVRREIDDNGDLLVRRIGTGLSRAACAAWRCSSKPSWLDPVTGGPRS